MKDQRRNLNPHKEARAAMWLYSKRYAEQSTGSMDFYDSLSAHEKGNCKTLVDDIEKITWRAE